MSAWPCLRSSSLHSRLISSQLCRWRCFANLPNECNHCFVHCNATVLKRVESYLSGKSRQYISVKSAGNSRNICGRFFPHKLSQPAKCLELCFYPNTAVFWPFSTLSSSLLRISESTRYTTPLSQFQRCDIKSPILSATFSGHSRYSGPSDLTAPFRHSRRFD